MSDPGQRELVYPFIVVTSRGGPYDDATYVAGVEFGTISTKLEAAPREATEMAFTVHTGNVPQLDLAAAHSGWVMATKEWTEDPSWSFAIFRRPWAVNTEENQ